MEWDYRTGRWKTMSGVLTNHTILPSKSYNGSRKRASSDNGEDTKFLSEALQQTLKLRVDLPFASKPQTMDNQQDGQKALITDHVRSIVRECLEEAEVCWPDSELKPEMADEDWTEPERTVHTGSPGPQSEVTAHVDSESLSGTTNSLVCLCY
ncbi:hypothetical protein QZH41_018227 [Actinostola sp. cb2023]|nr:hypothetical protein QZH41_018227 [Actinostola sp. cb2023]